MEFGSGVGDGEEQENRDNQVENSEGYEVEVTGYEG
jgi:hypothetical protein